MQSAKTQIASSNITVDELDEHGLSLERLRSMASTLDIIIGVPKHKHVSLELLEAIQEELESACQMAWKISAELSAYAEDKRGDE
ncbi:MAG: hypothetical protein AAF141_05620 [Pseudomonadota bacterium]